jgi:Tol biopolymer transport system component
MVARALFKAPLKHNQNCFLSKGLVISDDRLEWEWELKSVIIKRMKHYLRAGLLIILTVCLFFFCGREEKNLTAAPEQHETDTAGLRAQVGFTGTIVFQSDIDGDNEIYLLTSESLRQLTDNTWDDTYPRWSPDGKKIAFSANHNGNYDLFVMDENGENITQLTASPEDDLDAAWAPDGQNIVFTKRVEKVIGKELSIWILNLSSKQERRVMPDFSRSNILPDYSPRAPLLAFTGSRAIGWDVFLYDLDGQRYSGLTEGGKACRSRFSPDGRQIVYVSHKTDGKGDIWTMNSDGSNQQRITERDETYDYFPSWSPDGKQVVFCSNLKSAYGDKGDWDLYLVNPENKSVSLLFESPGRDIFPDWR